MSISNYFWKDLHFIGLGFSALAWFIPCSLRVKTIFQGDDTYTLVTLTSVGIRAGSLLLKALHKSSTFMFQAMAVP